MKEKLGTSDYRFIAICVALAAGTVWFSARNFYRAFPEASIDFQVNRDDGRTLAERFLSQQNYRTDGYREASSFTFDDATKTFLEREAGLEQANQIMGTRVRLWHWSYRWFRPLQKEEFHVDITPRGELAGFRHEIAEDAARPDATAAQARALAEDFLRTRLQRDPASLDFMEASDIARPHRMDRVFTWKERDFDLHDATNRVEVTVLGNEPGGYREYLKIPEQWTRDYERLRSKNQVASVVDTAVVVILMAGMVVVIVMRVRRQDVRWRRAAVVGAVAMALSFCASLNEFSQQEFGFETANSYGSFFSRQMLQALLAALGWGGFLFVLTAGAEPLYREAFRDKISLGNLFRLRGLRTKRFFLGAILGVTLTGIFIAYQTAFYIVAYKFGAWSPADVPYSDLLNTRFPWAFVLFGGFMPAVFEEFLFRMFAIPFLRRLVRYTAVAVVLAGFIWGFGHAAYPQQPFYIRGVEVGIGGVALGLIMLRWGILPTLVWHYSVDAMYSAMLLVRSHSLYFKLSGAASAGIVVLPIVVALVAYLRHGGFAPEAGLLNQDEGTAPEIPPTAAAVAATLDYRPLSLRARLAALAVFAIGLAALLIPATRFGESPKYKVPDEQARTASDAFLRAQGLNPDAFQHVTFPAAHWGGDDSLAAKYFLERVPVDSASRLFEQYRPVQHWVTRYFKSLDQEEIMVSVHPETGKVLGFGHTIPEDRPGADIPADAARPIAAEFARSQGWDLAGMELKEDTSEKKKARRDHTFEWEARSGDPRNLDEAHYRLHLEVDGDRVTDLRGYWKIPEAYERSRSQQNFISIAAITVRIAAIAGVVVFGILLLVQNIRKGMVRWGTVIRIAVPAALLAALGPLLSMRLLLQNYNTAIPLETYQAMMYVVVLMSAVFAFLVLGAAVALLTSFYPESVAALRAANRRLLAWDAIVALLGAAGLVLFLRQVEAALLDRFHAFALFSIGSPDLIVSAAPAVAAVAGAIRTTIVDAAVLGALALVLRKLAKPWIAIPLALVAAFTLLPGDAHTPGEFALYYGLALAAVAAAALFCQRFARANYLAYVLVLWALSLRGPLVELFGNPIPALQVQGWIVAGALAASVVWMVLPAVSREKPLPKKP
ncbi:Abortive infection protein [Candidatus Sulfopaludibacter sp. SbA4]|nr:Abortive infection protein [Candidatus Sulfopaludibacter sp. SbA4]